MGQFGPKIWICQCAKRHEVKVGRYTYNLDLENTGIIFDNFYIRNENFNFFFIRSIKSFFNKKHNNFNFEKEKVVKSLR